MFKIFFISIGLIQNAGALPQPVTTQYQQRNFFAVAQYFAKAKEYKKMTLALNQADLISGCAAVKSGNGGLTAVLKCMNFMNNEQAINIKSSGATLFRSDLDILCARMVKGNSSGLDQALLFDSIHKTDWPLCHQGAWSALFSVVSANFGEKPMEMLSKFRKAEKNWGRDNLWVHKIESQLLHF